MSPRVEKLWDLCHRWKVGVWRHCHTARPSGEARNRTVERIPAAISTAWNACAPAVPSENLPPCPGPQADRQSDPHPDTVSRVPSVIAAAVRSSVPHDSDLGCHRTGTHRDGGAGYDPRHRSHFSRVASPSQYAREATCDLLLRPNDTVDAKRPRRLAWPRLRPTGFAVEAKPRH